MSESALTPSAAVVLRAGVPCLSVLVPLSFSPALRNRFESVDGIRSAFFPVGKDGKPVPSPMTARDAWPVKMNKDGEVTGHGLYDLPAVSLTAGPDGARVSVSVNCAVPAKSSGGAGVTAAEFQNMLNAALADFAARATGVPTGAVERTAKRPKGARGAGVTKRDAVTDARVSAILAAHAETGGAAAGDAIGAAVTGADGVTVKHLPAGVSGAALAGAE